MGIRMLYRRPAPTGTHARVQVGVGAFSVQRAVPAYSAAASTARVPVGLVTVMRRALGVRDRQGVWGELVLGYVALVLTLLPRSRPVPTMTVFVAGGVSEGWGRRGSGECPGPGSGGTV